MKKISICAAAFIFLLFFGMQDAISQSNNRKNIDAKVDSLLSVMTLQEKVGQLNQLSGGFTATGPMMSQNYKELIKQGKVGSILNAYGAEYTRKLQRLAVEETRLGIPLLFGFDVIHGFRTIFPIPLAQASSWNIELIQNAARVAAREASAAGLHWTFAPMVDIARDPRWGRITEGAGEDPYLGSKIAAALVKGFQGEDLSSKSTILATMKHFAAYGAAIGGRDYNTVNMSERLLREIYLPPFKAAVDAGVATVMTAFNEVNGVPATANHFLLDTILREEWGFKGFVVSDWSSITEMIAHGVPPNAKAAAEMAIEAGVDMDMESDAYINNLVELVKEGSVRIETINKSVARILHMKFKLGLFKDPYRYSNSERQERIILSDKNRAIARKLARQSIVLLKNENDVLPLEKNIKSIAVIGPLADDSRAVLGWWEGVGRAEDTITLLTGIKKAVSSDVNVYYAKGAEITGTDKSDFDEAVSAARKAEVAIIAVGEAAWMSGEAGSRASLELPGVQLELLKAVYKTGTPVVLVLMNGHPLTINWADKHIPSILETWFLGTEAGPAIADLLFGDYNPSGKLTVTFPRTVGQVPIFYNHKNTGRPVPPQYTGQLIDPRNPAERYSTRYIDIKNIPLYPFGYGLSYTTFAYSDLSLSSKQISTTGSVQVSVTVKNTGDRAGHEIVQLYVRDLFASVTRPVKELRGFKKIYLEPGESKKVFFNVGQDDLSFYNRDMKKVVEPGDFKIMVGFSSRDADLLKTTLTVQN